jgi:hypothetical protein
VPTAHFIAQGPDIAFFGSADQKFVAFDRDCLPRALARSDDKLGSHEFISLRLTTS